MGVFYFTSGMMPIVSWDEFRILDLIETGAFGNVYKAKDTLRDKLYAVKVIALEDAVAIEKFERESSIAREVSPCKYCITTTNILQKPCRGVLVMEYMKTDLFSLLNSPLAESDAKHFFYQICRAIQYLHEKEIVHLDIKAENILIDNNFSVRLCDFGCARRLSKEKPPNSFKFGSSPYIPPEETIDDLRKVDIWGLGILLHYLLTTRFPSLKKTKKTYLSVNKSVLTFSAECTGLLRQLLQIKPAMRPNIQQVLSHDWFGP